jgi:hypothetical protein
MWAVWRRRSGDNTNRSAHWLILRAADPKSILWNGLVVGWVLNSTKYVVLCWYVKSQVSVVSRCCGKGIRSTGLTDILI